MTHVAITGASGLIGRNLTAALLARGDEVIALSRRSGSVAGVATTAWDPAREPMPAAAASAAVIVNLAGAGIGDGRWGDRHRRDIVNSRVQTTRRVVDAAHAGGPAVLVSASAIGYYGPTEDAVDEHAPAGDDFLAHACARWEHEAERAADSARVVRVRTGIVLSRDGGALPRLLLPARLGAGGPLAGGRQWMSWIHLDDEIAAILRCIDDGTIAGAINLTAPNPVRQREFAQVLGHVLHRPALLPTPGFAMRVLLGGAADIALTGQNVLPAALTAAGFDFRFRDLASALRDLLSGEREAALPAAAGS